MVDRSPTIEHIERGVEYAMGWGEISLRPGVVLWRYGHAGRVLRPALRFTDICDREVLSIRRASLHPADFAMTASGRTVGTIRRLSVLRTRYEVRFDEGPTWQVHVRLFRVHHHAISSDGAQIFIRFDRAYWFALTEPRSDDPRMLMALAFISMTTGGG
jgi:hypothetical protein